MDLLAPVESCPLCGHRQRSEHSVPPPNLYSEMLAPLVAISEQELLGYVRNVQCTRCGLIHKDHWFPSEVTRRLFRECVPAHPRGWDVVSRRFTPRNFQMEVTAFGQALSTEDDLEARRYRRALSSIIDSIPELEGTDEGHKLLAAIRRGDIATLQAADARLREVMREPAPFKRFSGFSATVLWEYVESRLGKLTTYAEVGCPLWGLLQRAGDAGCRSTYLDRAEPNYWSEGCVQEGMRCTARIAATSIGTARWADLPAEAYDAIGAFQYLDHLEQPAVFMDELFARARAAVLILDAADQPVALQHFTGWTIRAISWLAARHGCSIDSGFDAIRASGNFLVIMKRI